MRELLRVEYACISRFADDELNELTRELNERQTQFHDRFLGMLAARAAVPSAMQPLKPPKNLYYPLPILPSFVRKIFNVRSVLRRMSEFNYGLPTHVSAVRATC